MRAVGGSSGAITDRVDRRPDLPQVVDRHLQWRFVGLICRADRVVDARLGGHLDVASQNMRHRVGPGECDQPVDGPGERRPIVDGQRPGSTVSPVSRNPVCGS